MTHDSKYHNNQDYELWCNGKPLNKLSKKEMREIIARAGICYTHIKKK